MSPQNWVRLVKKTGFNVDLIRGFYYCPSIAFYSIYPLVAIDKLFRTKPFEIIGDFLEKKISERPQSRFLRQELIIRAIK